MEKLHKCISAYTYYLLSFWRLTSFKTGLKLYPSPNLTPKCTYLQEVTGKFPLWGPQFGDPNEGASAVFWIWIWNIWEGTCQTDLGMPFIFGRMPIGPVSTNSSCSEAVAKLKQWPLYFPVSHWEQQCCGQLMAFHKSNFLFLISTETLACMR